MGRYGGAPGEVPITWDFVKTAFLKRFFPREQRESMVMEFINLRQGGMSVREYSLKFVNHSKYVSSVVSKSRDEMRIFVTGVSEDLEEECWEAMLHDNVNLFRKRDRESKKSRPLDQSNSSTGNNSFGFRDRAKLNKGHKNSGNSTPSKNTNSKEGNDKNDQHDRKSCEKSGRLQGGDFLVGTNIFYGCGKSEHMVGDFPQIKNFSRTDSQPRPNPTTAAEPPRRNIFYALKGREEQEKSTDVVTGTLHVFSFHVYQIFDQGSTL
ncbi:uncharacterized protein LOC107001573 [Solanum pennellii]|uniref:Uncharacterized protein LOC107001573 n=1 Tax=Solanum pennellii TaxID=28526 RepID=A0ABM1FCS0_SOLPN|nr:uncharacterized protein LOC107001573 [Solanum pennellii]